MSIVVKQLWNRQKASKKVDKEREKPTSRRNNDRVDECDELVIGRYPTSLGLGLELVG